MSPDEHLVPTTGPRFRSLVQVRRWLIQLLLSEAWLFAALAGLLSWPSITATDRVLLAAGALCVVTGWILGDRPAGLWLIVAGPTTLVLAAAISSTPATGPAWIALAVSTGHVTYALVLLLPLRIAPLAVPLGSVALALIWSQGPGNVVPGALAVAGGWISVISLATSAGALWFVWRALSRQAEAEDARLRQLSDRIQGEIASQERSRIWRSTAIAIHERLLSTLRYVLQADTLDRPGLAALLRDSTQTTSTSTTSDLAEEVRQATAARIAAGIVRLDASALDLPLADDVRTAMRAAVVECALNAVLHGRATDVLVTAHTSADRCVVSITDNGSGITSDATPGIGWSSALEDGLGAVGGTWSWAREDEHTIVRLDLPRLPSISGPAFAENGFQQGRVLMSTPLLAIGLVGLSFDALIAIATPRAWPLLVVAVMATVGALLIVTRGHRPGLLTSSAVLAGLAAVPWLMTLARPDASLAPTIAAGLTTAGYTLIAAGMWSRWWQWLIGMIAWAVGVLAVARVDGSSEPLPIAVALVNCLIIVPVVIIVSAIGTRRYRQAEETATLERDAMNREAIRANSALAIDQHLAACVAQAEDIIEHLAHGDELDAASRNQVACLEGLIRATIQVDPTSSGEFAQAATRLVNTAFRDSRPVRVGTLLSSNDASPLDPRLLRALEAAMAAHGSLTVRCLTDGSRDHLSLELAEPRREANMTLAAIRNVAAEACEVEVSEDGDHRIVMVSRSIRDSASPPLTRR